MDNLYLDPTAALDVLAQSTARDLESIAVGTVGSIIAAAVFPPGLLFELAGAAGASGASALVSAYQDYGDTIAQSREGLGVDFNDPDQVAAAWNNEAMRKEILDAASKEWRNSALSNLVTGFIGNVTAGRAIPIGTGDPLYKKFVKFYGQETASTLFGITVQELTPEQP